MVNLRANPVKVTSGGSGLFSSSGLNHFPVANPIGSGPRVTGLPSPSIGTLIPVSPRVPVLPVASPYATPSVLASFGQAPYLGPVSLPRPIGGPSNYIGDRH